jgi:acetyl/propionyl-CoA carboxylase alpha subunit
LIEGVPRLNTSFALWENTAGTSAVAWQLAAMSSPGHADVPARKERSDWKFGLALRIYAEDPILQLPQPGKVIEVGEKRTWDFPGSSARLNLVIQEGVDVLPEGQGVLGHLLVGAEDRKRAITVARGVLDEVWIAGSLQTNERFLHELLTHPWVQEGMFHASFVDEEFIPSVRPDPALLKIFLRMAQQLAEGTVGPSSSKWAVGDQWIKTPSEQGFTWVAEPGFFQADDRRGITGVIQAENGEILRVFCYPLASDRWLARVGNWFLQVRRVPARATQPVSQTQKLTALVSGRVHSLLFREGASVPAHESALLVESLNMLISHALPVDVRVVRWLVSAEDQVQAGQVLAEFERAAQVR